jgi:hypothetical protein
VPDTRLFAIHQAFQVSPYTMISGEGNCLSQPSLKEKSQHVATRYSLLYITAKINPVIWSDSCALYYDSFLEQLFLKF